MPTTCRDIAHWRDGDKQRPSPTLTEFIQASEDGDNAFWYLESGDHQNLLDEAIDLSDTLREVLRAWHERCGITCLQCGQRYDASGCGPTHAIVANLLWPVTP